jgi:hypothetical protein
VHGASAHDERPCDAPSLRCMAAGARVGQSCWRGQLEAPPRRGLKAAPGGGRPSVGLQATSSTRLLRSAGPSAPAAQSPSPRWQRGMMRLRADARWVSRRGPRAH